MCKKNKNAADTLEIEARLREAVMFGNRHAENLARWQLSFVRNRKREGQ